MEQNKLVGSIVSLAVVIICCATILMPVINDAEQDTYTNASTNGIEYVEADSFTISKEADSKNITINDETITATQGGDTFLISDTFLINSASNGAVFIVSSGTLTTITAKTLEGTCTDGTFTYSVNSGDSVTVTLTNTLIGVPEGEGDYVSIAGTEEVYVENTDSIVSWQYSDNVLFVANGSTLNVSPESSAADDAAVSYTVTDNKISKSDIVLTNNSTEYAVTTMIVPKSVTLDSPYMSLYAAIPVIVLAGIVVAAVSIVVRSRE